MDGSDEDGDGKAILVPNFLQANDWKFSRFAAFVLTLQTIVLLLIFLDGYGLVPLYLRELVTFLFYSYVPGLVLLRVLRMHRLGAVLTTILSVAASVAIMMFVGFAINIIYLELNGPLPFMLTIMAISQVITLFLLLGLAFVIDRHCTHEPMLDVSPFLSAPAFALYSLPLVAVLATYLLNGWNIAWLQIILLLIIAAVVMAMLIVRLPSSLYPVAVVCIALAVLFHTSLVSRFVVEWADISFEYWSANRTLLNGFWPMTAMDHRSDSVLSVTILAPMYVLLTGLDLNVVFKIIYPSLLALIPLGVFCMARDRLGMRGALLSAFIIVSGTVFFTEFLGLARQIIAELLLVAVVALLLHKSEFPVNRTILAWFLAIGIVVSHYGLVAVIIPVAIVSSVLYILLGRRSITRGVVAKIIGSAVIFLAPPILWYGNVSGSTVLASMMKHLNQLIDGKGSLGLAKDLVRTLLFQENFFIHTWLEITSALVFCVLLSYGFFCLIASRRTLSFNDRAYMAVAAPFIAYSFLVFADTDLFGFISRARFFHICLLFTAPLIVNGGVRMLHVLNNVRRPARKNWRSLMVIGSVLIALFIGNTGVLCYSSGDLHHVEVDMNIQNVPRHSDGAFLAANFTVEKGEDAKKIYADAHRAYLLDMLGGWYDPLYGRETPPIYGGINTHLFFSSENLDGMLWLENPDRSRLNKTYVPMTETFSSSLLTMDKVYSSQESELYYKKY